MSRNRDEVVETVKTKEVNKATVKRNAAKAVVKGYLQGDHTIPADVLESIKYLAGMGARSQGMQISNALKDLLIAGPVSSVDIFTKFEYGRPTMEKKIRDFIKAEPDNRIWVAFEDGNYVVKGTGAYAPEGWTGYVPTEKAEL